MSRARAAAVAALAVALSAAPAVAAEPRLIDVQSGPSLALGALLWATVIYLTLVYGAAIRASVRSEAWDTLTSGLVLFVIGLILFQASVFVAPVVPEAGDHVPPYLPQVKISLLFLTVFVLVLFLAEWCRVFELKPTVLSARNARHAALAAAIAVAGTLLPLSFDPRVALEERVYVFPVVGIAAFLVVNLYFTVAGVLVVRTSPVFGRFKWVIADSLFMTAFLALTVWEFWALPLGIREVVFPSVLFYAFSGLAFLIAGYIYKVRALITFVNAFVIAPRKAPPPEARRRGVSAGILNHLAAKFLKTDELEAAVAAAKAKEPALAPLSFDAERRRFDLAALDLADEGVQRGVGELFFACMELLLKLGPPKVDREYTEDGLKGDILEHFSTAEERPPPGVEGYILPKEYVLAQAISEVMNKFLETIPLEAGFTKLVINAIDGVWGGEFVRTNGERVTFDGDAFLRFCKEKGKGEKDMVRYISRLYLRAHRLALEPFKSVMSREKVADILRANILDVASKPLYRAAGVSDIMVNAFFADSHSWGFDAIDRSAGRVPNKDAVLLVYDPDFPKEQFISGLLVANLRAHRNAAWVSQARHGITRHILSEGADVDALLEDGRLVLLSMDPNVEDSREASKGLRTIGVTFNKLSYELKRVLDEFPVSAILVVVELPVSAVKESTTMLYKFVFHLKSMCEKYDATLVLAADSTICGEETVAMLKGISELVVEARGEALSVSSVSEGASARLAFSQRGGRLEFSEADGGRKRRR